MPGTYGVASFHPSASAGPSTGHCSAYFLATSNWADRDTQSSQDSGALLVPAYQSTVPTAGPVVTGMFSVEVHHQGTAPPADRALIAPW